MASKRTRRKKPKQNRQLVWVSLCLAVAVACIVVYVAFQPVGAGRSKLVGVSEGASSRSIAAKLKAKGLIRSEIAFQAVIRWRKQSSKLKPGTYEVNPAMTLSDMADMFASGRTAVGLVTIPEGFTVRQIARRLEAAKVCSASQFMEFCTKNGSSLSAPYHLPNNLEGYLFPDTYRLQAGLGARAAAQEMVLATTKRLYKPNTAIIISSKHSFNQLLTVASLIEREARLAVDRPKISAVIYNRLAKNMRLQIDASVLYAKQQHQAVVYHKDLWVKSPYNTYRNMGLPPGPIASPGADSFSAALHPASTKALYYVATSGGWHVFSDTYDQHLAAIKRVRGR